jgi:hypothetical protein
MTIERARTVARVQGHSYCAGWERVARDGTGRVGAGYTSQSRKAMTRGVNGTDIIRSSDRPKRLIIRLDSFFRISAEIFGFRIRIRIVQFGYRIRI